MGTTTERVFKIELETCATGGGPMKVIACIEDPAVIKRILAHLDHDPGAERHPSHATGSEIKLSPTGFK